ncbi:hypothetical protein MAPG_08627 [Magnaporthiopsis poae ATCC 64411]|uniref:Uncharacterized protein n=1 Tax=Magnaporthiopsis poae (strain ATCC 64411 / 73-15) TaxID=644358 RepID=A0A0C4E7V2_MAGP6|nr:hypothetical protein MAPG_08627 [Magnaporthiopsis poae ATCC 64411]
MDIAYNQHSNHARRKNRSSTNLNHLTLAPLTTRLPIGDAEDLAEALTAPPVQTTSYLQGKSAPTTPGLLSQSPARSRSRSHTRNDSSIAAGTLPKSKSTTHLHLRKSNGGGRHKNSGILSPTTRRRRDEAAGGLSSKDRNDSDWMLRAGAVMSGECRESKGQAWLVSRASSTSLAGPASTALDLEEAAFERNLAREREHQHHGLWSGSRHHSRRGSSAALALGDDEFVAVSPPRSQLGSRSHSRVMTPLDERQRSMDGGYFGSHRQAESPDEIVGPDFVNLDESLEAVETDTTVDDEAVVRRLVKREQVGSGGFWFGNVLGWKLFSVEENDAESDEDDEDGDTGIGGASGGVSADGLVDRKRSGLRQFEGITSIPEERVPPPKADEGGWHDAAWLLSVASKVLL